MRPWFLAKTKPLSEYLAAGSLEAAGHEFYFPLVETPKPRTGKSNSPLFPGYIFVRQQSAGDGLPCINNLAGIAGWVKFSDDIPAIPHQVIELLLKRVNDIDRSGGVWNRYLPGEKVNIVLGSIETSAEIVGTPKNPESRVQVLMDFMGQIVRTEVSWRDIRPSLESHNTLTAESSIPIRRTRGKRRWINGYGPRASNYGSMSVVS